MKSCDECGQTGGHHLPSCSLSEDSETAREAARYQEQLVTGGVYEELEELPGFFECLRCGALVRDRDKHRSHHSSIDQKIKSAESAHLYY